MVKKLQNMERKEAGRVIEPDAGEIQNFLEIETQLEQPIKLKSGKLV
jgi:hypothetical protein